MLIWVAVLGVAALAGFGLGALTYEPPAPELDVPQTAEPAPPVTPSEAAPFVPDVVGMRRAAAESRLEDAGVLFVVDAVGGRNDDQVVGQNPGAGAPVKPATSVLLKVRCDPKPCSPPEGKQVYDPCSCAWR